MQCPLIRPSLRSVLCLVLAAPGAAAWLAPVPNTRADSPDGVDSLVDALAAESIRVAMLCKDIETTGRANDEQREFLASVVDSPPEEFSRVSKDATLPLHYVLEIHLARFAHDRLRATLDSATPPRVEDLLELASEDFLVAKRDSAVAIDPELAVGIDASLARPLSARWLLFAALREDRLFEPEGGITRSDFISRLLLASESSVALAFLVRGALQPPFVSPWGTEALAFPAGPFKTARGKVGFTEEHEAIVRSLEENRSFEASLGQNERVAPPSGAADVVGDRDDFAQHLSILRDWILSELHPDRAEWPLGSAVRNVNDLEHEWRTLADSVSPNEYWSLAKPMLLALLRGEFAHALDARIAELSARGTEISEDERKELARLRLERDVDRSRLLRVLPELFAERAPVADALDQLIAFDRELVALGVPELRDTTLSRAFASALYRDPLVASQRLRADFAASPESALPPAARAAMIRSIAVHAEQNPGSAELLARCAREGSNSDRLNALAAIRVQPPEVADELIDRAGVDSRALLKAGEQATELRMGFASAIEQRARNAESETDRARVAAMWIDSFERDGVNLWQSGLPGDVTSPAGVRMRTYLANLIPESDWRRLDLAGKLPDDLKRFRD